MLSQNDKLKDIVKDKLYGFDNYFLKLFQNRLENLGKTIFLKLTADKWVILLKLLTGLIPNNKSVKERLILNIFFLDLIVSYRGWRHARGLPVRGQRTWTNAWTVYKNNLTLREYKLTVAKKLYGNLPLENLNVTYLAEQINLLWKLQWENEWKEAKKKRLVAMKSNYKSTSVDLYSMSKGIVDSSGNKKSKKKNIKSQFSKNLFTLGFDPGFTKALIKANYTSNYKSNKTKQGKVSLIFNKSIVKAKKK